MATKFKKQNKLKAPVVFGLTGTDSATNLADITTIITNTSGKTLSFGFIPPHGKELTSGESVTVVGDLAVQLKTGGGRDNKRKVVAFQNAITNKLIRVARSVRHIVYCAVDASTVITAGDLLYLDTDDVKPAGSFTWDNDLATTQAGFADVFLGVALDAHATADGAVTDFPVDISPNSLYAYLCASETHEIGDTFGPDKQSGDALESQKLEKAVAASSIARAHKRNAVAATTALVTFQSAYWGFNAEGSQ